MTARFSLTVYNAPGGKRRADWSGRLQGGVFTTGPHGYLDLTGFIEMPAYEAFSFYDSAQVPHLELTRYGAVVWEGRLEDVTLVEGGIEIKALGYWAALYDVPYTELWVDSSYSSWRAMNQDTGVSGHANADRFMQDNNNRLYIALVKGNAYALNNRGGLIFKAPHSSTRYVKEIEFTYEFIASADFQARIVRWDEGFTVASAEWTITGTGVLQSGTVTHTFSGTQVKFVGFEIAKNTAGTVTYTSETGVNYFRVTGVKVKTQVGTVFTSDIIAHLITAVRAVNPNMLSASLGQVVNPVVSLTAESYEDQYPGDIANYLASLGDVLNNPWEVGVGPGRVLYFRTKGATAQRWVIDLQDHLVVERSLGGLINSVYAVHQDPGGRAIRSTLRNDVNSIGRYGLTRRAAIPVNMTNTTSADNVARLYLEENTQRIVRADITVDRVLGYRGNQRPDLWNVTAGDFVTVRNLPPVLIRDIDLVTSFVIQETRYDLDTGLLTIIPEGRTELLESYLAKVAEGLVT